MKRARTLMAAGLTAVLISSGCDNQFNLFALRSRPSGKEPAGSRMVSEPMTTAPPASAPASSAEKTTDAEIGDLGQRIDQYLSRLSAKNEDQGKGVAGGAISSGANGSPQTRPTFDGPPRSQAGPTAAALGKGTPAPRKPLGVPATTRPATDNAAVMASPNAAKARSAAAGSNGSTATARGPRVELVDVRPAVRTAQPAQSASPNTAANRATTGVNLSAIPADMSTMISQLEQTVRQHPEQLDDQLKLRLLYLLTGQDAKATAPIQSGDPVQAEYIIALLKTLRNSRNMITDPAGKDPSALAALDELCRLLGQQLPVSIPRIALVTRINSFGDYQALNPPKFAAGRAIHVFLYTEVYNFRSEPTDDGKLRTVLSEKVEIFDSAGRIVWQRTEPSIIDRVVTPRRDFFIPFPINLPGELPAGDYILKVTVEDKIGATADQQKLTFSVGE